MDRDLAWKIIVAAFEAGRPLDALIPELKENLGPQEYDVWLKRVAMAIDGISAQLTSEALKQHPELEKKIEEQLNDKGRVS